MRIDDREISANVEDRRGRRMGSRLPMRGGAGAIILVLGVMIAGYYGIDLTPLLSGGGMAPSAVQQDGPYTASPEEERWASFTGRVLKTTEDVWSAVFRGMGRTYSPPKLVLYTGTTETGCGFGDAATGPFYCPADQTVYLDLSFFREMESRLGGGGDFAYAYVLAHEVGHHVQHLLGTGDRVRRLQEGASQVEGNRLSVRLELQADAYAGVWGHYMQKEGVLDAGDLEEALKTAEAIGDDRLQRQSGRAVVPDSFTHGTSEQRYYWFKRGFDSGDINQCDTFTDPR